MLQFIFNDKVIMMKFLKIEKYQIFFNIKVKKLHQEKLKNNIKIF